MAGSPSLQASEKGQAGCVHLDTIEQHLVSLTGLDRHGVSTIGDLFGLCLRIAASLGQVPGVTTALGATPGDHRVPRYSVLRADEEPHIVEVRQLGSTEPKDAANAPERLSVFLTLLSVVATPCLAHAWISVGHRVIASIAYQQLGEAMKQPVAEVLLKHSAYADLWSNRETNGPNEVLGLLSLLQRSPPVLAVGCFQLA